MSYNYGTLYLYSQIYSQYMHICIIHTHTHLYFKVAKCTHYTMLWFHSHLFKSTSSGGIPSIEWLRGLERPLVLSCSQDQWRELLEEANTGDELWVIFWVAKLHLVTDERSAWEIDYHPALPCLLMLYLICQRVEPPAIQKLWRLSDSMLVRQSIRMLKWKSPGA